MVDVGHPINIEQKYCPYPPCPKLGDSHVQIRNVTFKNIWGTSKNKVAVNLQCSKSYPCQDIQLIDINLIPKGPDGPADRCVRTLRFCSWQGVSSKLPEVIMSFVVFNIHYRCKCD
ncbi:unnamed protein product [Brassica rapa subsp. narinosa]